MSCLLNSYMWAENCIHFSQVSHFREFCST